MSDASDVHSGSEVEAIAVPTKKEKRQKKEKKEKSSKKRKVEDVVEEQEQEQEEDAEEDEDAADDDNKSSKKRKRDILPEEIEIDVSAPEPASKKAARKAKKAKTAPTTTTDATTGEDGETATASGDKDKEAKRSEFSVWIGNLPWSATKETLRTFLTSNAEIKDEEITRIHMPAPKAPPRPNWTDAKPTNKGFAYVDFATQLAMYSAIALTETRMDRRPLLIKNSKNFEGRPDKPKEESFQQGGEGGVGADGAAKGGKAPSKKIFVGNLGFETSKEDLIAHFKPCGVVENIHMATFEDTGKCKGYAWVTFEELDAASAAVKGFVYKKDPEDDGQGDDKSKKKKFRLNKLLGRDLRCEFAEDSTTRYNKRYGKEKPEGGADGGEGRGFGRPQRGGRSFNGRGGFRDRKVDPRTIAPGSAHMNAPRASAAIVKSEGKKTTFD